MRQHRRMVSRRAGGLPRCWSRGDGPTGPLPPRGASVDSSPLAGRGPACDWSSLCCLVWPRARGGGRRSTDGRSMGRVCGLLTGRDPYRQIPIRSCVPGTGEEVSGTKARLEIWPYGSLVAHRVRDREPGPSQTGRQHPLLDVGERVFTLRQVGLQGPPVPDLDATAGADDNQLAAQPGVVPQVRRDG